MRGWKSTLALLVVLVGLGAYIYFVDSKKPVGDAAKEKAFTGVTARRHRGAGDQVETVSARAFARPTACGSWWNQ